MVHRPSDSRLLTNLLSHEKDYTKQFSSLLLASQSSLASFSAYASASTPPVSQAILAVAGSLAGADDALRRYMSAVEQWKDMLRELKEMEDEVGVVMRDREILVTRLIKVSKSQKPTRESLLVSGASSSSISLKSDYSSSNTKLTSAQAELQACEAHLAAKEQELALQRCNVVKTGLSVRCTALVECGWVWGEMGKEGLRALEVVSNVQQGQVLSPASPSTKPLPDPTRPSSDLSSLAPSQSASQVTPIATTIPGLPHSTSSPAYLPSSPIISPILDVGAPHTISDRDYHQTTYVSSPSSSFPAHFLSRRITEEDLNNQRGSSEEEDNDTGEVQVVDNPRFTSSHSKKNQRNNIADQLHFSIRGTKSAGPGEHQHAKSDLGPTTSTSHPPMRTRKSSTNASGGFFGSLRILFGSKKDSSLVLDPASSTSIYASPTSSPTTRREEDSSPSPRKGKKSNKKWETRTDRNLKGLTSNKGSDDEDEADHRHSDGTTRPIVVGSSSFSPTTSGRERSPSPGRGRNRHSMAESKRLTKNPPARSSSVPPASPKQAAATRRATVDSTTTDGVKKTKEWLGGLEHGDEGEEGGWASDGAAGVAGATVVTVKHKKSGATSKAKIKAKKTSSGVAKQDTAPAVQHNNNNQPTTLVVDDTSHEPEPLSPLAHLHALPGASSTAGAGEATLSRSSSMKSSGSGGPASGPGKKGKGHVRTQSMSASPNTAIKSTIKSRAADSDTETLGPVSSVNRRGSTGSSQSKTPVGKKTSTQGMLVHAQENKESLMSIVEGVARTKQQPGVSNKWEKSVGGTARAVGSAGIVGATTTKTPSVGGEKKKGSLPASTEATSASASSSSTAPSPPSPVLEVPKAPLSVFGLGLSDDDNESNRGWAPPSVFTTATSSVSAPIIRREESWKELPVEEAPPNASAASPSGSAVHLPLHHGANGAAGIVPLRSALRTPSRTPSPMVIPVSVSAPVGSYHSRATNPVTVARNDTQSPPPSASGGRPTGATSRTQSPPPQGRVSVSATAPTSQHQPSLSGLTSPSLPNGDIRGVGNHAPVIPPPISSSESDDDDDSDSASISSYETGHEIFLDADQRDGDNDEDDDDADTVSGDIHQHPPSQLQQIQVHNIPELKAPRPQTPVTPTKGNGHILLAERDGSEKGSSSASGSSGVTISNAGHNTHDLNHDSHHSLPPPPPPPHDSSDLITGSSSSADTTLADPSSSSHLNGTAVGGAGEGTDSDHKPKRRKSVRVSLKPTFSPTPPAIYDDDDTTADRYAPWSGSNSSTTSHGKHPSKSGSGKSWYNNADPLTGDVWQDSSDEDEEYSRARRLLSKVALPSSWGKHGGKKSAP